MEDVENEKSRSGSVVRRLLTFSAGACPAATGGLEFDLKRMHHLHPALIRHVLLLAWQQQGWPLQDMSMEKWDELHSLVLHTDAKVKKHSQDLPGGIRAIRSDDVLQLLLR